MLTYLYCQNMQLAAPHVTCCMEAQIVAISLITRLKPTAPAHSRPLGMRCMIPARTLAVSPLAAGMADVTVRFSEPPRQLINDRLVTSLMQMSFNFWSSKGPLSL